MTAATGDRRVALVTGASSGIGRASAVALARRGFDIGLTYRGNAAGAADTAATVAAEEARVEVRGLDLEDAAAGEDFQELIDSMGRVDALVNNAGANRRCEMVDETVAGWGSALAVNLVGPAICAALAAADMRRRGEGGSIVNVTSILAMTPLRGGGSYGAAKAGLELATKAMALEWAADGIRVNTVAPGHTATTMNFDAELLDGRRLKRPVIPAGRAAGVEEIAAAVTFLADGESSYVTGASILVDGGLLLASGPDALQDATGMPPEKET